MVSTTLARQVAGQELPVAGRYEIDPGFSSIGFEVPFLKVARGRGVFKSYSGEIEVHDEFVDSSVLIAIDAASIDTLNARRDDHLRSGDFLSAAEHPLIVFQSRSVDASRGALHILGDLQIRGISRPVVLDAAFRGAVVDPWGTSRIVFTAGATLDREDWEITWNLPLDSGGHFVGRDIRLNLDVQAVRIA